jgi:hypothetical protein
VLRSFEQGLLRLNVLLVMLLLSCATVGLAAIWLDTGRAFRSRLLRSFLLLLIAAGLIWGAAHVRRSWDVSENRRNSFSAVDEAALRQVNQPLKITIFLAPEDPRLTDFEQNVLKKLRRSLGKLDVEYAATSRSGLFENAEDHYGEIWYELGGQKAVVPSTIEEVVLDQIYQLANVSSPDRAIDEGFPGYPLAAQPKYASAIFYFLWPLLVIVSWILLRR